MNNTDLIEIFRDSLNKDAEFLPLRPGPPQLGGANQQHLTSHFKLNSPDAYEVWAPKAMKNLAEMVSHSFPGAYEFFQLNDPGRHCPFFIIEDPWICIRQYNLDMPEKWSEPNELADETFVPRLVHEAHVKVVFEVVFTFGLEL